MRFVRRMLMHVCVTCSIVCIAAKILDWFNPYMDFSGHVWLMQNLLYFSVIVLGLTRCVSLGRRERKQRSGRNVRKYEKDFTVL